MCSLHRHFRYGGDASMTINHLQSRHHSVKGLKNNHLGQAPYPFGTSLGRSAHLESNSNGVKERACQAWWKRWNQPSWKFVMTTKLTNLPCGTVEVRVCADQICATGWVSSHHLVPPKEAQLRKSINRGNESISE